MLAFAAGWAMLAVLSIRMTSQAQRWAFVPAGVMGLVGTALVLFAPGDHALTILGWLSPLPMLALAVWIAITSHRHLQSWTRRWLLYPVVAFLALTALGGGYQTVQSTLDVSTDVMPGQSYDVGSHRLHLNCAGAGSPTVVLESGSGESSPAWAWITRSVAAETRVCAYDRAGQGWSEDSAGPQDGATIAADLHTLLQRANEPGPYVLVGHSAGGPYSMVFAQRYPNEVAGLVLLDSMSPETSIDRPTHSAPRGAMDPLIGVVASLSRLGLGQLLGAGEGSTLPPPANDQAHAFASNPRDVRSSLSEFSQLSAALAQARKLTDLGAKPLAVITAAEDQQVGWSAAQDRLATLSANSVHRVAPATHGSLITDEGDSANSVRAIGEVVHSVRTHSPLPTS